MAILTRTWQHTIQWTS